MKMGKIINTILRGIGWFMIQLFALFECYLIAFMCTGAVSSVILTICSFIPVCSTVLNWIFARYGLCLLILSVPVMIYFFIYMQVSIHRKPEDILPNIPVKK